MEKIRTKFEVPESVLVELFIEKMKRLGNAESGTYNRQDPTHWEKIEVQLYLDNGEEMHPIDIVIKDMTWITTISFSEFGSELAKADWDPQDKKWTNMNAPAFFDLIYKVFLYGMSEEEMSCDSRDPHGCLADYE